MVPSFKNCKSTRWFSVSFLLAIFMFLVVSYVLHTVSEYVTFKMTLFEKVFPRVSNKPGWMEDRAQMSEQWILDCMTNGEWVPDPEVYSEELETRLNVFFRKTRDLYKMPNPLQRADNRCGSVTLDSNMHWFRAVCDPFRSTPCCFKGTCTHLSVTECRCTDCVDLRPTLHGELSKWVGHQSVCPIKTFTSNGACEILRAKTLVFIGDSFMRQMYMGTQILLTNNDVDSCVWKKVPKDKRDHCLWMYMFTRECRFYVSREDILCNGTVTLRLHEYYTPGSVNLRAVIQRYKPLTKSTTFIVGVGLHYSFNTEKIIYQVALSVFGELKNMGSDLDHVYWMLPHSLGILKFPNDPGQTNSNLVKFNSGMREFLTDRGVTMVDAFNLTRNLASYDGVHYPKAANILKVQILLNHLVHKTRRQTTSVQNHTLI